MALTSGPELGTSADLADVPDMTLLSRTREGDMAAFAEIYRRYEPKVRRAARAFAIRGHSAEDWTAEAFEKLLDAVKRGQGPRESVLPYLYTIVRRLRINALRSTNPEPVFAGDLSDLVCYVDDDAGRTKGFEDDAVNGLVMREAFADLPERWQAVLWSLAVEDMPVQDLAARVGMAPNAISRLYARAKDGLRKRYILAAVPVDPGSECDHFLTELLADVGTSAALDPVTPYATHLESCASCRARRRESGKVAAQTGAVLALAFVGLPLRVLRRTGLFASFGLSGALTILGATLLVGGSVVWLALSGGGDAPAASAPPPVTVAAVTTSPSASLSPDPTPPSPTAPADQSPSTGPTAPATSAPATTLPLTGVLDPGAGQACWISQDGSRLQIADGIATGGASVLVEPEGDVRLTPVAGGAWRCQALGEGWACRVADDGEAAALATLSFEVRSPSPTGSAVRVTVTAADGTLVTTSEVAVG